MHIKNITDKRDKKTSISLLKGVTLSPGEEYDISEYVDNPRFMSNFRYLERLGLVTFLEKPKPKPKVKVAEVAVKKTRRKRTTKVKATEE